MRSYLYVYKIKKEESSDIFLKICHSIENKEPLIFKGGQ